MFSVLHAITIIILNLRRMVTLNRTKMIVTFLAFQRYQNRLKRSSSDVAMNDNVTRVVTTVLFIINIHVITSIILNIGRMITLNTTKMIVMFMAL